MYMNTYRQTDLHACMIDRHTHRQMDRQMDRQTDRQTDRQIDRQTGRQTDRQADRQTAIVGERKGRTETDHVMLQYVITILHKLSHMKCHHISMSHVR